MRNINFFDHFRFFKNRPKWKSPAVGERTLWKWVGDIIRRHLGGKLVRIEMNVALSLEETPAGYWLCVFWFFFSSSSTCSLLLFFFLAVSAFFFLSFLFFILNFFISELLVIIWTRPSRLCSSQINSTHSALRTCAGRDEPRLNCWWPRATPDLPFWPQMKTKFIQCADRVIRYMSTFLH